MTAEAPRDPIKALLDDLEQSIASIDARLEQVDETLPLPGLGRSGVAYPAIEPEARRQLPPTPPSATPAAAAAVPAAVEAPPLDLLAELAEAAAERSVDDAELRRRQQAVTERLHQDLKQVFDYLNQLIRHANTLRPALPRGYRLDARNTFSGLAWHDGFVDYRSTTRFDRSYYEQLLFQVQYRAPQALAAVCPTDQAPILRRELAMVNLRVLGEDTVLLPEGGPGLRFTLQEGIPLHLTVRADFDNDALILRCRNAGTFGPASYRLAGGTVNRPLLDGIGLVLLGRSETMPRELQPIPCPRPN